MHKNKNLHHEKKIKNVELRKGEDGKGLVYISRESSTLFRNTHPLMPIAVLMNNSQYTYSYIQ